MQATEVCVSDSEESIEGFIANSVRVEIDPAIQKQPQQSRPADLEPRFISGLGLLLRKEPQEIYRTVPQIEQYKQEVALKMQRRSRKAKDRVKPIHQKYTNLEAYRLVYSRLKEKTLTIVPTDFTSFLVSMDHLIQYKEENYTALRQFKLTPNALNSDHLVFDSRFESGNLMYSYQSMNNPFEYHLVMQNDTNTKGYNQWFYFSVEGMKSGQAYTIRIVNFKKKHSLFAEGMRPFVFSMKKHALSGNGWSNILENVVYESAGTCISTEDQEPLYQLSFDINFAHSDDYVLISMGLPYSYSKLIYFLKSIKPTQGINYCQSILAHSVSNNPVPIITITSKKEDEGKKLIGLVARQHPGETWSSYLMEGIIAHLLGNSQEAKYLRDRFIFQIIPMLNVDGVIYGNFRCDINGFDLNRQWKIPHRIIHPQVWALKTHIRALSQTKQYEMFLDLHGHSKKYNVFCYTCKEDFNSCRVLPLMISKLSSVFHFPDCTYGIEKSKANTARAFVYNAIKNVNVLTIQCSFYGTNLVKALQKDIRSAQVFKPKDMYKLAGDIIKAINIYANGQGEFTKSAIQAEIITRAKQFAEYDKRNENDSGSESDPYSDQMDQTDYKKILTSRVLSAISNDKQSKIRVKRQNTQIQAKSVSMHNKSTKPIIVQSQPKQLALPDSKRGREATLTQQKKPKVESISPRKRESFTLKTQKIVVENKNKLQQSYFQPLGPFVEMTECEPRVMFRTRNAIFLNKPNIKSSFKEFNFVQSEDKYIGEPRHNRIESELMESRYTEIVKPLKKRSIQQAKSFDKSKMSKYTNQSITKKIEQQLHPLLQQKSLNQSPDSPEKKRSNEERVEISQINYQRASKQDNNHRTEWITESNSIFQIQRRPKNNIVNFDRFHKRSEIDKNQRQIGSSLKRNLIRYGRAEEGNLTEH